MTESQRLLGLAEGLIPTGAQTFSKSPSYFPESYPRYLQMGIDGCVWDVDNNHYLDFILGLATVTLGYQNKAVDRAIREQLDRGISFSLPHPLEVTLSQKLHELIPCAEMVRFTKTGSEACQAAIRIARAATGRNHVAYRGYHGFHDWYACASERPKGIPRELATYMHQFAYNNLDSLAFELTHSAYPCAAVILEPTIFTEPEPGFLQGVVDLAHQNGAVCIFDETITGFRWSLSGAQGYYGVRPDLSVFGKGMANGMPLAAVVGKADLMCECEEIFFSSTFGGETLSLSAAVATIGIMESEHTIEHCWDMGKRLQAGLRDIGYRVVGAPCRPHIELDDESQRSLLMQELVRRGVLSHSVGINLCATHTEADIDMALDIYLSVWDAIREGATLTGRPIKPAFKRL